MPTAFGYIETSVPASLSVGSAVNILGISRPSNATRTNCEVLVNINSGGYEKTTPGKPGDFTSWTFSSGPIIKAGENKVTAKFECFAPGNMTTPNFRFWHSFNVTGS
jgi:hypothetical protein